jgi:DNA-binding transcriptional LysR family regulator
MLDVRRLRLLHDLGRLGTIAAVADVRSYTPSAVSQQLAALEREAGVALLERTGRRVTLTAAGQVLVRHAGTVLAALETADATLAAVRTGPAGPLRIGAFPSAVRTILPAALVALGRDHPGLELMVTELDPAGVPSALRDRVLDAGLVHAYSPSASVRPDGLDLVADLDGLDSVPLLDEEVFVAVPSSVTASEVAGLRDEDWILASPGTLCREVTLRVCGEAGFTPRVRHQADDFTAVLALVAAGQGVSLVPALATGQVPAVAPRVVTGGQDRSATPATGHTPADASPAPIGVRLISAPTRRRTRIAFRRGAGAHPSIAALVDALKFPC